MIALDGLEVDLAGRVVRRDGEEVHLTPTEFELLRVLVRNRGRLMTHRALLAEVWGPAWSDDTATLRTHIANLRRKIEPRRRARADPHRPRRRLPASTPEHGRVFTESCTPAARIPDAALTRRGRTIDVPEILHGAAEGPRTAQHGRRARASSRPPTATSAPRSTTRSGWSPPMRSG